MHLELFAAYPDFTLHTEELLAREDSNTAALHFTARGESVRRRQGLVGEGRRRQGLGAVQGRRVAGAQGCHGTWRATAQGSAGQGAGLLHTPERYALRAGLAY